MSNAFAPIVRARPSPIFGRPVHQGSPPFDYSPILLLKPFGFRITPDTLSSIGLRRWPARHYPRLWIQHPSSECRRDFNPPDSCAAQRTLRTQPPPSHLRSISRFSRLYDLPCSGDFAPGRGGLHQLLGMPLLPCCRFHPAEVEMPHRSDFGTPCCLRPTEAGSALGFTPFEATFTFTVVTARQLVVSPRETLSIGFRILISLHPAIRTTGRLTFSPAGLPPAEHTSLTWTHFRTASFPQYGWKADCPSGAFLGDRRLKPAPGIRRPPSSLHPPFVHFVVATVVRSESGLRTRSCTAMRWKYSTYPRGPRSGPGCSVPVRHHLIGPIRPTRRHIAISPQPAYTRCLRCAGAPRRPASGSGL